MAEIGALSARRERQGRELAADSPELRLELTCDDEPIAYCLECWEQEFEEAEDAR